MSNEKDRVVTSAGCTVEVWRAGPCVAVQIKQPSGKTDLFTVGWGSALAVAEAITKHAAEAAK